MKIYFGQEGISVQLLEKFHRKLQSIISKSRDNLIQFICHAKDVASFLYFFSVNIYMVYDSKTFQILHKLTPYGEEMYRAMLEEKANEILKKNKFKLMILDLIDKIKSHLA